MMLGVSVNPLCLSGEFFRATRRVHKDTEAQLKSYTIRFVCMLDSKTSGDYKSHSAIVNRNRTESD